MDRPIYIGLFMPAMRQWPGLLLAHYLCRDGASCLNDDECTRRPTDFPGEIDHGR